LTDPERTVIITEPTLQPSEMWSLHIGGRVVPSVWRATRLSGNIIDEPPIMWSPGFEAEPTSPAGQMQAFWRFTGRGSDVNKDEAKRKQRPVGRVGAFVLRLLGYRPRRTGRKNPEQPS
jgi:hypothetical protein